ncbi:MAG: HRDC domain-containing protein [Pseudomonadota bacterium]
MAPQMESSHKTQYAIIKTTSEIEALSSRVRGAERVAVDTEADSLHHYFEKVCLIQLTLAGENYIVDPLAGADLASLISALADKTLILHGADYDLRMLASSLGFRAQGEIFDTMIAARLLGYKEIGLAALVLHHFGVTLPKRGRKSDWSRRPLTLEQLSYASDDTRYLEPLADKLRDELEAKGRLGWHREACAAMVRAAGEVREKDPEDDWRIKGTAALSSKEMAFVSEIWKWREDEAQRVDLPPFKILMNEQIVAMATGSAASGGGQEIPRGAKLPRNCTGPRLAALHRAIEKARKMTQADWPRKRKSKRGEPCSMEVVDALRSECLHIAKANGLEPSLLAPRALLASIARSRPASMQQMIAEGPMMNWQAELLWPGFEKILSRRSKP